MNGLEAAPEPMTNLPDRPRSGDWGLDSLIFAFAASGRQERRDIWMAREPRKPGPHRPSLIRLTDGPFSCEWPLPSADGTRVFIIGTEERNELVRYGGTGKRFIPYLEGQAFVELDFSRDARWLTYVSYPERSLWKARADGSDAVKLSSQAMIAMEPRWSPDGSQIAFMGQNAGGPRRIYIVNANGGESKEVLPDGPPQGVPTWSPDGEQIVFGDVPARGQTDPISLHILDLKKNALTTVPHSVGLWTSRWSPNGRFIAALEGYKRLKVYDLGSGMWQDLVALDNIEHPRWTTDSTYIYFRGVSYAPAREGTRAIYRVHVRTRKLEMIADLDRFPISNFEWFGIMPDGTPIGLRGILIQNVYAIRVP
jgi:hypothetical protein